MNKPHCIRLLSEWEYRGRGAKNRPVRRLLVAGSNASLHDWGVFTFAHDRGHTPFLTWEELQAHPEKWTPLGYDSNHDGDCVYCAKKES